MEFVLRFEALWFLMSGFIIHASISSIEYRAVFLDTGASDTQLQLTFYGNPTVITYWTNHTSGSISSSPFDFSNIFQRISGTAIQVQGAIRIEVTTTDDVALIGIAQGSTGSDAFRIFERKKWCNRVRSHDILWCCRGMSDCHHYLRRHWQQSANSNNSS